MVPFRLSTCVFYFLSPVLLWDVGFDPFPQITSVMTYEGSQDSNSGGSSGDESIRKCPPPSTEVGTGVGIFSPWAGVCRPLVTSVLRFEGDSLRSCKRKGLWFTKVYINFIILLYIEIEKVFKMSFLMEIVISYWVSNRPLYRNPIPSSIPFQLDFRSKTDGSDNESGNNILSRLLWDVIVLISNKQVSEH